MENRRSESARETDDSELVDNAEPGPAHGGSSGGNLQRDVASEAEVDLIRDPAAHHNVQKQDKIDHQQEQSTRHPADKTP
jgi:hypothetical protein